MKPTSYLLCLRTLTALHIGAGEGDGLIDLPVLREAVTGFPVVPSSTLKGAIASHNSASGGHRKDPNERVPRDLVEAFGRPDSSGSFDGAAGRLSFTDLHLVCLPVSSVFGTFAMVTSPLVLRRFAKMLELFTPNLGAREIRTTVSDFSKATALVTEDGICADDAGKAYLHDLELVASSNESKAVKAAATWFHEHFGSFVLEEDFVRRFMLVHDDVFRYLCANALQVRARNGLEKDQKKTAGNALWYEEAVPEMACFAGFMHDRTRHLARVVLGGWNAFQLGGKETVGCGWAHLNSFANLTEESAPSVIQGAENDPQP